MLNHHDDHDVDLSSPGMSAVSHIDSLHHHHHPDHLHLDMADLNTNSLKSHSAESTLHHNDDHMIPRMTTRQTHEANSADNGTRERPRKDKPARVTREQCRHTCGCSVVTVGRSAHERVDSIHPLCSASCAYYAKLKPISEEFAMKRYANIIHDKTAKVAKRDYTPQQCRHTCGCAIKTVGRSAHERVRSRHANCDSRCPLFVKLVDKVAPEVAKERLRTRNRLYLRERCRHTCGCNMNTVGRSHHERIKSRHPKCDPSCPYYHKLIDKIAAASKAKAASADGADPPRWRLTPQQCRHQCGCNEVVPKRSQHERNIRAHPDCAPTNCALFERMTTERNRPRKKKTAEDDDDDDADADADAADEKAEAQAHADAERDAADASSSDHHGAADHISFEFSLIDSSLTAKAAEAAAAAAVHADMETFTEAAILRPHNTHNVHDNDDDDDDYDEDDEEQANRKRNRRRTQTQAETESEQNKRMKSL